MNNNLQKQRINPLLKTGNTTFSMKGKIDNLKNNNLLLVLLFGICIAVLVYLLLLFNRPSLLYYTLAGVPVKANDKILSALKNTDKLPALKNGREYAYSFWTYIQSIDNSDDYRLVFLRGKELGDANPFVYFDKKSNKMVIKVKTNAAGGTVVPVTTGEKLTLDSVITNAGSGGSPPAKKLSDDTCKFATFEIDYVPLQRWVNIIINVDNYVVTVFMDGAIHSTRVLNENNDECNSDLSKIVAETSGEVKIGNSNGLPAFNGYISRLQFFNYSLKTQRHISKIYQSGPVESPGILQKLGLPLYSFRNPIYRVDSIKA
jgi:hypothetical protein|tara:strand:- start:24 stop:974 length:951 start_codon:yes stop_codon:yes gene_type:complete